MNTKADATQNVCDSQTPEVSLLSPRQFFLLLGIYFGLQTVIRAFLSGTIDLDESEQLILTQKLAFGYGSQPPLYTWLQIVFFKTFGVSVFALALLKNLLLLGIYVFTYSNARFITRSHLCGMLAAISLLFLPQVSWESQRDLTHSVLASTLVTATLFVFLRMREKSWRDYALLGFCAGLGLLSKYNYAAFFLGLVCSALTLSRFRKLILNWRIVLSLLVCLVILSPHLLWAFENRDLLTTSSYKFHQQQESTFLSVVTAGLGRLFVAVVSHVAPILVIFAVVFLRDIFRKREGNSTNEFARLFVRKYGFILAGLILAILSLRITGFKDRWFEPIFISLPLLLFVVAQNWVKRIQSKQILVLGGVVAMAVLILIPGRIVFAKQFGRPQLLNAPVSQLKAELREAIPPDALVIAETKWLGGNLRLQFPQQNVVTPELAKLFSATNRDCVIVWDATKSELPKPAFARFLTEFGEIDFASEKPEFVAADYQHFRGKKFRLGMATVSR